MRRLLRSWLSQARQSSLGKRDKQDSLAQYNTYDARNLFCELVRRVRCGERIVIAHAGIPVAIMTPFEGPVATRAGVIRAHLVIHTGDADYNGTASTATPTRSSPAASS
jgi:antitoxin (DNA-binding transcriptional repressor) of toxin-antitoxin stability system